jgi:hypothetical protein
LLPCQWEEFPRNRWLTKLGAFTDSTLMSSAHSLLERTVPMWVVALQGKPAVPYRREDIERPLQPVWSLCDVPVMAGGGVGGDDDDVPDRARRPHDSADWSEFNAQQRGDSLRFVQQKPRAKLLVVTTILQKTLLKLNSSFLDRAGASWWRRRILEAVRSGGKLPTSRIEDAHSCRLTNVFFSNLS